MMNQVGGVWNEAALAGGCFPLKLLPRPVVAPGAAAGRLRRRWLGVGVATPLLAALGDMQCGVFSILGLVKSSIDFFRLPLPKQMIGYQGSVDQSEAAFRFFCWNGRQNGALDAPKG